jgi:hypothetical protein
MKIKGLKSIVVTLHIGGNQRFSSYSTQPYTLEPTTLFLLVTYSTQPYTREPTTLFLLVIYSTQPYTREPTTLFLLVTKLYQSSLYKH